MQYKDLKLKKYECSGGMNKVRQHTTEIEHGLLNIRTSTLPCVWKIPDALFENETLIKYESI